MSGLKINYHKSEFRYHRVKWENLSFPKDYEGLGIINTRVMNDALLLKWWWRLYNAGPDDPCCNLLKAKYLPHGSLATSRGLRGSQFWKGIHKAKHKLSWGAKMNVNNGKNTLFWDVVWAAEVPLRKLFPVVYDFCRYKTLTVSQCFVDGELYMDFARSFDNDNILEWENMCSMLQGVTLNEGQDQLGWSLERSNCYSTRSMYCFLTFRGVVNKRFQQLWRSKLPLKLKVFMWMALQGRLPSGMALKEKKNGRGIIDAAYVGYLKMLTTFFSLV
ncbi:hypothetical protein PVAP13_9KG460127 [Panicum virgatum]|uniref:Reverse transcriptase zinc-binding domain-containing protein n=1 Tax=Panicum virgatum TaxID=38727 RepID=A0A8T0NUI4_PANVG|nr:hypothetical protein PVAP13_9KG460127 [Panicum virgatum]